MNRSRWEERELCWVESGRATCSVQRAACLGGEGEREIERVGENGH